MVLCDNLIGKYRFALEHWQLFLDVFLEVLFAMFFAMAFFRIVMTFGWNSSLKRLYVSGLFYFKESVIVQLLLCFDLCMWSNIHVHIFLYVCKRKVFPKAVITVVNKFLNHNALLKSNLASTAAEKILTKEWVSIKHSILAKICNALTFVCLRNANLSKFI